MNFTEIPKCFFSLAAMVAVFVLFYALIYPKEEVFAPARLGVLALIIRRLKKTIARSGATNR